MSDRVADALATPLTDLRTYWLETRCCVGLERSPLWYYAVCWPDWLLSDLAMDHSCPRCGALPALALLRSGRDRMAVEGWRLQLADRFVESE